MIDNIERQDTAIDTRIEKTVKLYYSVGAKFLNGTQVTRQRKMNLLEKCTDQY